MQRVLRLHEQEIGFQESTTKRKKTWTQKSNQPSPINGIIFRRLSVENSLVLYEIPSAVSAETGIKISKATAWRRLKNMRFSRKRLVAVPRERNSAANLDSRAIYAQELSIISHENLVFLRRQFGYSRVNSIAYKILLGNRGVNRSLLCAISLNRIVAYEYRTGSFNENSFIYFITQKFVSLF